MRSKLRNTVRKYSEFIAEGDKIIKELIDNGIEVVNIFTVRNEVFNGIPVKIVSEKELNKITALQHHYNSLAVFKIPDNDFSINVGEWIVLLDDIQDPGNLGTIIRTCDWFGIHKIICSGGCVDAYNPKVVQASMASVGRVQIREADLKLVMDENKLPVYGAVLNGKNYHEQDFSKTGFILIGNEGHGIHRDLQKKIDYPITIPRKGGAESLNAAIATALILDKLQ